MTDGAGYCPYCGSPVSADASPYSKEGEFFAPQKDGDTAGRSGQVFNSVGSSVNDSEASLGLKIVAFLFPFIGLIVYLINRKKAPSVANAILPWVIAGVVKNVIFSSIDGSYASLSAIGQIGRIIRSIS